MVGRIRSRDGLRTAALNPLGVVETALSLLRLLHSGMYYRYPLKYRQAWTFLKRT